MIYRFEDFEVREEGFCLMRAGQRIPLEPKALSVLLVLVARAGRLVEKRSLMELVWADTFVEENTLTRTIGSLRRELGDNPKEPRLIETIPTRGYRFVAPVEVVAEGAVEGQTETVRVADDPAPVVQAGRRSRTRTSLLLATVAAVVVVGVLAMWLLPAKPAASSNLAPVSVPLTTYQGDEMSPSFSPDGNQVAFEWDGERQNNFDIYVKGLGPDAAPLRLTTDPQRDQWPAWSPDGRTIAFQRIVAPNRLNLMLIPALGGPERKLAELTMAGDSGGFAPVWSTDSKWLIVPSLADGHEALFRVSVETGELTQITRSEGGLDDVYPAMSPDGRTLAFNHRPRFYNWGAIYMVRLDENAMPIEAPQVRPPGDLSFGGEKWTPDGKEIVARSKGGVVRLPVTGSAGPQLIPWLGTNVRGIAFSQHGNRLAYALIRGDANIWRIDLTAKVLQPQRLIASTFRDVYPQYSPDGRRIVFQSYRTGDTNQIWIGDAEGNQPRQLTFVKNSLAATPHWSPDGRTLEFDSNVTGKYQIYTISPDGGKMKQLTEGPFINFDATWSRDGRWMYFTSNRTGRNEIWKMPDGGGTAVQVTRNGGAKAIESQDGKTLYFSKDTGEGSIWKMPSNGGPEEQLVDSLHRDNFAVVSRGIYYMTGPGGDGTSALKFYSFATGTSTVVLAMGRPEYGLDVSPDGRYLVYAQLDDPASDLMLVEDFH